MSDADAGNRAGAVAADQVCGHHGQRGAGVFIVQHHHEDGAGKALFPVGNIRAVPFHTGHLIISAEIRGHCHEAAVVAVGGHSGELWVIRENDLRAMGVVVFTAHDVVPAMEGHKGVLHNIYARIHIFDAGPYHVRLT